MSAGIPSRQAASSDALGAEPGNTINGRYDVLGLIGEGGMAKVYEVRHRELGRRFALKLLRLTLLRDSRQVERFQREARVLARLESTYIVAAVDCGITESGAPFFVMERLRGCNLRELMLEHGPLPVVRAVHIALDACRGLAAAHAAGIVHRDLKPENLFITRDGEGSDRCKVLDFGVAKLMESAETCPGELVGTRRYMAPEQISATRPVEPRTDIFALGVILFEILTGTSPFDADTPERALFKIMNDPAPSARALRPDLDPALSALIERTLAKDPAQRPASAQALAVELARFTRRHLDAPGGRERTSAVGDTESSVVVAKRLERHSRRFLDSRGLVLKMGMAAVVGLCGLGLAIYWVAREARDDRAAASTIQHGSSRPLRMLEPSSRPPRAPGAPASRATPTVNAPASTPIASEPVSKRSRATASRASKAAEPSLSSSPTSLPGSAVPRAAAPPAIATEPVLPLFYPRDAADR